MASCLNGCYAGNMDTDSEFLSQISDLSLGAQVLAFAVVAALRLQGEEQAIKIGNYGWKLGISKEDRRHVMRVINECYLYKREREWTSHGVKRSFRFWSEQEKVDYLSFANEVIDALRGLTPNVCFGYGSALAMARSDDLIPHDDDLDLIIAMPGGSISGAIPEVESYLTQRGFKLAGSYVSHRHVGCGKGQSIDIFIGIQEGDYFSSYPGPRRAIKMGDVFPPNNKDLYGCSCPVPNNLEAYLSSVYGPDWKEPDPNFSHNWDRKPYSDIMDS